MACCHDSSMIEVYSSLKGLHTFLKQFFREETGKKRRLPNAYVSSLSLFKYCIFLN